MLEKDRTVGCGSVRKQPRSRGLRVILGVRDELGRAADAHEMRHIEFAVGRPSPNLAGQFETVGLRQHRRHGGSGGGIVPQIHDCGARSRVAHRIVAR